MRENAVTSESTSGENISEEAIREALSRILESAMFIQSDRLSRFLRFTVEATLAGEADMLKEYLIGTEVYDRKPPYHPNTDSVVRSEARWSIASACSKIGFAGSRLGAESLLVGNDSRDLLRCTGTRQ